MRQLLSGIFIVFPMSLLGLQSIAAQTESGAVTARWIAVDANQWPVNGLCDVAIRYFAVGGGEALVVEYQPGVEVMQGRLNVELGSGNFAQGVKTSAFNALLASHPKLELEIVIDGVPQQPRVYLLPAGRSHETSPSYARADDRRVAPHVKDGRSRSRRPAVQTTVLRPSPTGSSPVPVQTSAEQQLNPYLVDIIPLGVSIPVRDLPTVTPIPPADDPLGEVEINRSVNEDHFDKDGYRFGTRTVKVEDPLARASKRESGRASPAPILSFDGIANIDFVYPADPDGAIGTNHYIQVVNLSFKIFDKSGIPLYGPFATNSLWIGVGGPCGNDNSGDAIFVYDELANRWLFAQFAAFTGSAVCFAVSQTDDPTGSFDLYQLDTVRIPEYLKLGVWPDAVNNAYFMSTNSGLAGQYDVYAIDRENLVSGLAPRPAQYFPDHANMLMPADLDGDVLPPTGSPGIFYTFRDGGESYFVPPSPVDSLDLWEFAVDWDVPANSTFTQVRSLTPPELADFNWTVCGFFEMDCLPQPFTSQRLDSLSWWPMQRLQYRNFSHYESLVGSWTVDAGGGHAAPRWFELRRPSGGNWSVAHQGTFAPDAAHRWMPSVALDGSGNMAMGYTIVDPTHGVFPSIRYATRLRDSSSFDSEYDLAAGQESATIWNRWGDYSSMEVDPMDNCTFWFTSQYVKANTYDWSTRIASFKEPTCDGSSAMLVTPASRTACTLSGSSVTYDIDLQTPLLGTTNLSTIGCPLNATCTINPNPVVGPASTSVLTISGLGAVAPGKHWFVVVGTDSVDSQIADGSSIELTVANQMPGQPSLVSPPNDAADLITPPFLSWTEDGPGSTYHLEIATDSGFTDLIESHQGLSVALFDFFDAHLNTRYYWRVRARNGCGGGPWSTVSTFTMIDRMCSSPGLFIPDGIGAVFDQIEVFMFGEIADLKLSITASHTWVGELQFRLYHDGVGVWVIDQPGIPAIGPLGCSGDNIAVELDDEAARSVEDACNTNPAISGVLAPNYPLADFDGSFVTGTWTLRAEDLVVSPEWGFLDQWCLEWTTVRAATPEIFIDSFEGGNTEVWSLTVP